MNISVTQEHINRGVTNDCGKCPVALALSDAFPSQTITVEYLKIHIGAMWIETPDPVREFLPNFDWGDKVVPFSFDLPIEPVAKPQTTEAK